MGIDNSTCNNSRPSAFQLPTHQTTSYALSLLAAVPVSTLRSLPAAVPSVDHRPLREPNTTCNILTLDLLHFSCQPTKRQYATSIPAAVPVSPLRSPAAAVPSVDHHPLRVVHVSRVRAAAIRRQRSEQSMAPALLQTAIVHEGWSWERRRRNTPAVGGQSGRGREKATYCLSGNTFD